MHNNRSRQMKLSHIRNPLVSIAALLLIAVVTVFLVAPVVGEETKEVEKVDLKKVTSKPAHFVGKEIRVEGVVTRVADDKQMFFVAEKSACGGCPSKKTCGVVELPISYKGTMPKKSKTVKVVGVLTEPEKGEFLFKALRLE